MPNSNNGLYGGGDSNPNGMRMQMELGRKMNPKGVVFSARGSFNPTNLAIEQSLQEIFNEFEPMVTDELRMINDEEDEQPVL